MKAKSKMENSPAQRDSENSILAGGTMGLMRLIRVMGVMGKKHISKISPAQRDSGNSKLGVLGSLRILGGQAKIKKRSAQHDSGMSKLGVGLIGPMGPIGLMSQKPVMENNPAQPDSGMSKLGVEPENRPAQLDSPANAGSNLKTCPYRPLDFKTSSAQRDSGISTLRMGEHCHTEGAEYTEKEILTKNIKNIMGCFMGRWGNEPKSKMQNGPAQRHSRMSNLKIETENSLPQRHSRMSNGRLSVLLCWPHGQRGISTMQIKNVVRWFMGRWVDESMTQKQSAPAQQDSRMSKLTGALKNASAQRGSGNSILKTSPYRPYRPLDFKNHRAQQDSGISTLKVETENSLPQRHSKMSNGRLSAVLCWPHGHKLKAVPLNGTPESLF